MLYIKLDERLQKPALAAGGSFSQKFWRSQERSERPNFVRYTKFAKTINILPKKLLVSFNFLNIFAENFENQASFD